MVPKCRPTFIIILKKVLGDENGHVILSQNTVRKGLFINGVGALTLPHHSVTIVCLPDEMVLFDFSFIINSKFFLQFRFEM